MTEPSPAREWLELHGDICFIGPYQREDFVESLTAFAAHVTTSKDARSAELEGQRDFASETCLRLREEVERLTSARKHTQTWYSQHYGKLEDWARKRLPEPWVHEFFNCVANGTWGHEDTGEPYTSVSGHHIVPTNYFSMGAQEALLHDQMDRAETAELRADALAAENVELKATIAASLRKSLE